MYRMRALLVSRKNDKYKKQEDIFVTCYSNKSIFGPAGIDT